MKFASKCLLIGIILNFSIASILMAAATKNDEDQKLKTMISELEQKVEDADKRMIAHPSFLKELRALVDKYKSQLRELFFRETFDDGNYDKNPTWFVKSGRFSVNEAGRLSSFVALQTSGDQVENQPQQNKTLEEEAVGLLIGTIFGTAQQKEPAQEKAKPAQETVQPATIYTKTVYPPDFEMNMKFKSSAEGEMDITLLGSEKLLPRYHLKIKANHTDEEPIEIIRLSNSRSFMVGASNKFPVINDGKFHTLSWIRLTNGSMNVLIDGNIILQTYEGYYRDNFTGFEVANNGGSYEWDSFEIFKALKANAE
jgi:hypothetical protein